MRRYPYGSPIDPRLVPSVTLGALPVPPRKPITLSRGEGKVRVSAPYNRRFQQLSAGLVGLWDPARKEWVFSEDREDKVRAACEEAYPGQPLLER